MSKNRGSKEELNQDSSTIMSEQKSNELHKQKIARIHDTYPCVTKDTIAKILIYYDGEECQAMDAIIRDGGVEALSGYCEPSNSKNKNKNKKKKKKGKKDNPGAVSCTASFDADDSSSMHSSGNIDADGDKDSPSSENSNGIADVTDLQTINQQNLVKEEVPHVNITVNESACSDSIPEQDASLISGRISDRPILDVQSSHSNVQEKTYDKSDDQIPKKEKFKSITEHHRHNRQRTNSVRRSKSSSISVDEDISSHNSQASAAPTTRGYEKCKKDISKQTSALQRIQAQLDKQFDESSKKMKSVFGDLQKQLENRQKELELEFSKAKIAAFDLLKSRQDLAITLKQRLDRTHSLSEAEWSELRSDVKQFVCERRYDDELGKMIWFHWKDLSETIKSLGEVPPVKNVYSQRSHSGSSSVGPSVSKSESKSKENEGACSAANEATKSPAESNEAHNSSEAVEETPVAVKEDAISTSHKAPHQNSRIFLPSKHNFPRSSGTSSRGYPPGVNHRGGPNFPHPNYRGNNPNYRGNNPKPHYYDENRNFNQYRGGPPQFENYDNRNNYHPRGGNRRGGGYRGGGHRPFAAPRHQNNRHQENYTNGPPRHQEGFNSGQRHNENVNSGPRHHENVNSGQSNYQDTGNVQQKHHDNVNSAAQPRRQDAPLSHSENNKPEPQGAGVVNGFAN